MTTPQTLRQISRELYAPITTPMSQARPLVRPSDQFKQYSKITFTPRISAK